MVLSMHLYRTSFWELEGNSFPQDMAGAYGNYAWDSEKDKGKGANTSKH